MNPIPSSGSGGLSKSWSTGYRDFNADGEDLWETREERQEFDRVMQDELVAAWQEKEAIDQENKRSAIQDVHTVEELAETLRTSPEIIDLETPPSQTGSRTAQTTRSNQLVKRATEPTPILSTEPPHPLRSRTLPVLDDPFFFPARPNPKPSTAMVKLLEDHAKFLKKEEKGKKRGSRSKLFERCTFAVVMSQNAFNSLRDKWTLILLNGGNPVVRYDPSVTHLVADPDVDETAFLKFLGLRDRSEIKPGIQAVSYEWVSTCLRTKVLQPLNPYLIRKYRLGGGSTDVSMAETTRSRSRASSPAIPGPLASKKKMSELVDAVRVGKRSKRDITPTDSDTEESRSLRRKTEVRFVRPLPPVMKQPQAGSSKVPLTTVNPDERFGLEPGVPADPLDEIILGVKMGTVDVSDEALGQDDKAVSGNTKGKQRARDNDEGTDDEDPEADAARGIALRAVARRQAHKERASKVDGPHKAQQDHDGKIGKDGPNEDIALAIEELAKIYRDALHKNKFQRESYQRVANLIRNVPYRLESGKQALEIRGIGTQMAERIQEYLDHGRTARAAYEDNPETRAVAAFGKIYGVGPALAHHLVSLGARTLDDLREDPVRYGLTDGHKFGLEFYDDLNERIPRHEVTALFELVRKTAVKIDSRIQIEPMGSYRRGEDTSGDLDILLTRDPSDGVTHSGVIHKLVHTLVADKVIYHTVSTPHHWNGLECKWMGTGRVGPTGKLRRIDILAIPFEQYGAALIYFTGNERFNRSLRYYANRQGYSLNQRGLYKGILRDANRTKQTEGTLVASKTEAEIFKTLGIRWRPPHLRRP